MVGRVGVPGRCAGQWRSESCLSFTLCDESEGDASVQVNYLAREYTPFPIVQITARSQSDRIRLRSSLLFAFVPMGRSIQIFVV